MLQTIAISKGLDTPASKFKPRVPPLNFPPGRWKEGKTPKVSKGKVGYLHNAGIGEAVFTDTLQSGDSKYRYGQAYVDLESRFGAVFPLRSRTSIGDSLADFAANIGYPSFWYETTLGKISGVP